MNLLYVHSGSDLYGAGRCLLRLCNRLCSEGHQISVILPEEGPLAVGLKAGGAEVLVMRSLPVVSRQLKQPLKLMKVILSVPVSVFSFIRLLRRVRPEILHVNTAVMFTPALAAKVLRIPVVWHIREFFSEFPQLWRFYRGLITRLSNAVVCVSDGVAHQFPRSATNVRTIHDGFPAGEFGDAPAEEVAAFRSRYGLNGNRVVSLVGRIKLQRKGQEVLARAAPIVAEQFPNVKFVCVGGVAPGNEEHLVELSQLVKQLAIEDKWVVTGDLTDVNPAYGASDVLVLASALPEPFGGVVVEGMAMGLPVIGTNIGGTPEQIVHGVTGFLVEPNSPAELATRICDLLSDGKKRGDMGRAGRKRFLESFEYETFHKKMLAVYNDLIGSPMSRDA